MPDLMSGRKGDWIQTRSGRRCCPLDPRPEEVCVEDIAHALSNLCRYGGHCSSFYSVAQHSVLVCQVADLQGRMRLWALLHDAAEAYLGDIPRPIKQDLYCVPDNFLFLDRWHDFHIHSVEDRLLTCIGTALRLPPPTPEVLEEIKRADNILLRLEAEQLMAPLDPYWSKWLGGVTLTTAQREMQIVPWVPEVARRVFLEVYHTLDREFPVEGV